MKKNLAISGAIISLFLLTGCATKEKETLEPKHLNKIFKKLNTKSVKIPNYKNVKIKKYIVMKDITIKEAIEKLNEIYGTNYFYVGENIILPSSSFKVYTPKDLKYYVEETTKYYLYIEPNYNKHKIVKVKLIPKGVSSNYTYFVAGETKLLDELFKLSNSKIQVVVDKNTPNKIIKLAINTKNPNEFIKAVCEAGDVWCELDSNRILYVKPTKLLTINIDKDGKMSFGLGGAGEATTGATTEGGSGEGEQTNTGSSGTSGFTYSIGNFEYTTLIKNLTSLFNVEAYPGENGYIQFDVSPSQYKKIKKYFSERDARKELINAQIDIYRIDLNNNFKFGVDWNLFTNFLLKGINGLQIQQKGKILDSAVNNGSFISLRDKALYRQIENYINKHKDELTYEEIMSLRQKEYTGIIQALEEFGKVYKIDSFSNQFYTGKYIPFGNYETIRYFTIGSTGGEDPEPITEVNTENVGFQGSIIVNKLQNGYDINGFIQQSAITGYTSVSTKFGEIKAPNTTSKNIRIKTHLSSLGRTIIIGGFRVKGINKKTSFTPYAGNIPLFGYLFKNKDDLTRNSEFVVVIHLKPAKEGQQK